MLFDTGLSTTSTIALAVMAAIFISFALISSFVLPRRDPDFPGKKWRNVYVIVSVCLFLAMMGTVLVFGKEDEEAHAEETAQEHPGETSSTTTNPNPTTTTVQEGGIYANGNAEAGKLVFVDHCGVCHTLSAAGTTGTVGPNLDQVKPDEAITIDRVVNGKGAMPAFKGQLTDKQIADVVAFVHESTQGS